MLLQLIMENEFKELSCYYYNFIIIITIIIIIIIINIRAIYCTWL